jgi:hypothetical protein
VSFIMKKINVLSAVAELILKTQWKLSFFVNCLKSLGKYENESIKYNRRNFWSPAHSKVQYNITCTPPEVVTQEAAIQFSSLMVANWNIFKSHINIRTRDKMATGCNVKFGN